MTAPFDPSPLVPDDEADTTEAVICPHCDNWRMPDEPCATCAMIATVDAS